MELNGMNKTVFMTTKLRHLLPLVSTLIMLTTRERESDTMNLRIRKLVPCETIKLMGFERKDYQAMRDAEMSDIQIFHCAGDSIVVTCLMGIFGQMLMDEDTLQKKIKDYVESIKEN